jgi:hypothetical protein
LKKKRLCAGFDARLFYASLKRDGRKKASRAYSQISKPQLLRVAKSLRRFFMKHARKLAKAELQKRK